MRLLLIWLARTNATLFATKSLNGASSSPPISYLKAIVFREGKPVPDKSVFNIQNIGVSLLGGVTATVIFAVVARGGGGGLFMALVAPLPILIVALGFGVVHGATSAILASVILTFWPSPQAGMLFGVTIGLPAFLAAYAASGAPRGRRDLLTANLPSWAALAPALALVTVAIVWLIAETVSHGGSLDEALSEIRGRIYLLLEEMAKSEELKDKIEPKEMSGVVARAMPAIAASYSLMILVINLWVAGRVAQASDLLSRPWPDIAMEFHLPRFVGALFVTGLVLSFFPAPYGAIGLVLLLPLGLLLAFQGLAVVHVYLRGSKSSALVLSIMYFTLGLLVWPLTFFAALGLADIVFDFRKRFAARIPADTPTKSG